ncbi:hypothetical protein AAG906_003314 [Vitis piasezkii]
MDEAKPVSTPLSSTKTLLLHDGSPACDATEYRQFSQYMHQPSTAHWAVVKRVLRYLKGTMDYDLFLRSHSSLALHDNYSSTSTYVIFLGPNLVNWLTHLLQELGIVLPTVPTVYCDNVGATYVSANPIFHSRMKHIAIDFHFVSHVHPADQLADSLTKPLAKTLFQSHRSKFSILPNFLRLWGHERT